MYEYYCVCLVGEQFGVDEVYYFGVIVMLGWGVQQYLFVCVDFQCFVDGCGVVCDESVVVGIVFDLDWLFEECVCFVQDVFGVGVLCQQDVLLL